MIVKRIRPAGRTKRTGELFIGEHEYQNAIGGDSVQFRMSELTFRADGIANSTARPAAAFLGAAVAYVVLALPSGWLIGAIERKVAIRR